MGPLLGDLLNFRETRLGVDPHQEVLVLQESLGSDSPQEVMVEHPVEAQPALLA